MINTNETKRAEYFLDKKIAVHIIKTSGEWMNGTIKNVSEDFFILDDRIKGEQFIYFSELKKPIEPYRNLGDSQ